MLEAQKKKKENANKNKKSSEKEQEDPSKKILHNKGNQKNIHGNKGSNSQLPMKEGKDADDHEQQIIQGEFENLGEDIPLNNSNATLIDNNIDNTFLYPLLHACELLESEKFKKCSESNIRQDQKDSFEEELPDQQQQDDIDGELELNNITCEDGLSDNNIVNYGSKLLTRDKKDGNYRITQGIPRSIKFRSIDNLYKCTPRLSPIEDEYNWNRSTEEDQNVNHLANNNGEKDATSFP